MQKSTAQTTAQSAHVVEQSESEFFNQLVEANTSFNPFTDAGWKVLKNDFVSKISDQRNLRILDIGCGTGASRQLYIDHAREYTGVDISTISIQKARTDYPNNRWLVSNACNLPLKDNSVDVVVFSSVLHHIPDYVHALHEAHRVVVPGGIIFAFDPNLLHPVLGPLRHPSSPFYLSQGVSPNERPLLPCALHDAFTQARIITISQNCRSSISYRKVDVGMLNAMLGFYNLMDHLLEYSGLGRWFGSFVITSGRKAL